MNKLFERIKKISEAECDFWVMTLTDDELPSTPILLNSLIVCLCKSGTGTFYIDTKTYLLHPGDEAMVFPGSTFTTTLLSSDFTVRMFIFSREIADMASMRLESVFFKNILEKPILRNDGQEEILDAYFTILNSVQSDFGNRYRKLIATNMLRNHILTVSDKFERNIDSNDATAGTRKEDLYGRFMDLVFTNCNKHRDVSFYADKLCITQRYLAEITNAVGGVSPKEEIDYAIIHEIKLMLAFTNMSVQEITFKMNFPDQSYLGRFFRRHTGMSPLHYRKSRPSL